ncbi:MAG: hypothetical protein GTN76_03940 [Candidatus Aenigmarchaeota archaeon]|nr:hypothetical protein [Candidatus Aenigmarchaeota archaeon]
MGIIGKMVRSAVSVKAMQDSDKKLESLKECSDTLYKGSSLPHLISEYVRVEKELERDEKAYNQTISRTSSSDKIREGCKGTGVSESEAYLHIGTVKKLMGNKIEENRTRKDAIERELKKYDR